MQQVLGLSYLDHDSTSAEGLVTATSQLSKCACPVALLMILLYTGCGSLGTQQLPQNMLHVCLQRGSAAGDACTPLYSVSNCQCGANVLAHCRRYYFKLEQ